jgi:hypothetical protein
MGTRQRASHSDFRGVEILDAGQVLDDVLAVIVPHIDAVREVSPVIQLPQSSPPSPRARLKTCNNASYSKSRGK